MFIPRPLLRKKLNLRLLDGTQQTILYGASTAPNTRSKLSEMLIPRLQLLSLSLTLQLVLGASPARGVQQTKLSIGSTHTWELSSKEMCTFSNNICYFCPNMRDNAVKPCNHKYDFKEKNHFTKKKCH